MQNLRPREVQITRVVKKKDSSHAVHASRAKTAIQKAQCRLPVEAFRFPVTAVGYSNCDAIGLLIKLFSADRYGTPLGYYAMGAFEERGTRARQVLTHTCVDPWHARIPRGHAAKTHVTDAQQSRGKPTKRS